MARDPFGNGGGGGGRGGGGIIAVFCGGGGIMGSIALELRLFITGPEFRPFMYFRMGLFAASILSATDPCLSFAPDA